jgi:DNA-binding transcriptional regulator YhcF (GntR family)
MNRHSTVPPYQQVAADLRERIASGDLPPGSRLPAYATLAREYQIGMGTITRDVQMLRDAGLVETGTGTPSYIREPRQRKPLVLPPGSTAITRMPTPAEREDHDIEPGVPVFEVTYASGEVKPYAGDRWMLTRE